MSDDPRRRSVLPEFACLALLFAIHFWNVKASNMGGYEWPNLHLASRGITDFPHANRPLTLVFHLVPALLWPHDLRAYLVVEWIYFLGGAAVLHALLRRRAPDWPELAPLAAAFLLTWAPADHARLQATVIVGYAGTTLFALGLVLLFFQSWRRGSVPMLVGAAIGATALAQIAEAALPLLAGGGLLLTPPEPRARLRRWLIVWFAAVGLAVARALVAMVGRVDSYQASLRFDPHPVRMLGRLAAQFAYHLEPLVRVEPAELAHPAVFLAVLAFGVLGWSVARSGPTPVAPARALGTGLTGLAFAGLGYLAFVAAAAFVTPVRTQILSAPGIAVALVGLAFLLASGVRPGWRAPLIGLFGAWVVAVGTGRTLALQRDWDVHGRYPAQRATLLQLLDLAPDVKPHTFFVLIDDTQTFPAVFAFRHAVEHMYARRASGLAWAVPDLFYPYSFGAGGLRVTPFEPLQRPWQDPETQYGYDELVVFLRERGRLRLLETWPERLPALPPGALYAPKARVLDTHPNVPARALLTVR